MSIASPEAGRARTTTSIFGWTLYCDRFRESAPLAGLLALTALVYLWGLISGHAEVAIGSRLAPGARVRRCGKRELISHAYNRLLRTVLRARFSDAQCGFKAGRSDVAPALLDEVSDQGWFFDTELLMAAQRRGLRIQEVAVDWTEDPDSRVDIVPTAIQDLRGLARLALRTPVAPFLLAASTMSRYVVLRTWVFGQRDGGPSKRASVIRERYVWG